MTQRRLVLLIALAVSVLALVGLVLAQTFTPPEDLVLTDPGTWFGSTAALAGVIFAATAFIKERFKTEGPVTLAISFGLGIVISLLAVLNLPWLGRLFDGSFLEAIGFGVAAALLASGGVDGLKQLFLGKPATKPTPPSGGTIPR